MAVIGRLGTNSITRGYLYAAICSLPHATSSSSVTVAPSSRMTTALISSPWLSWGTPITAASETRGVIRTSSISRGYTL